MEKKITTSSLSLRLRANGRGQLSVYDSRTLIYNIILYNIYNIIIYTYNIL